MEVSTEISQKIRSAIKAKLMELGAYVDDELPDYIMVMVANKRSRSQMNKDLGLFLGTNTSSFTEWLHSLLGKLQTIKSDFDKSADKQGKVGKLKAVKDKQKVKGEKQIDGHSIREEQVHSLEACSEKTQPDSGSDEGNKHKHISGSKDTSSLSDKPSQQSENEDSVRPDILTDTSATDAVSEGDREAMDTEDINENARPLGLDKQVSSASQSPGHEQSYSVNRKRKLTSELAEVSRESEVFHPYKPAFANTTSELTSDKSSSLLMTRNSCEDASEESTHDCSADPPQHDGQPPQKVIRVTEPVQLEDIKQALAEVLENSTIQNDDIAHFSRMLESSLRKLRPQDLSLAKMRIQQILYEFETLAFQEGNQQTVNKAKQASCLRNDLKFNSLGKYSRSLVVDSGSESVRNSLEDKHTSASPQTDPCLLQKEVNDNSDHLVDNVSSIFRPQINSGNLDNHLSVTCEYSSSNTRVYSELSGCHGEKAVFHSKTVNSQKFAAEEASECPSKIYDTVVRFGDKESAARKRQDQSPQSPGPLGKADIESPSSVHSCPLSSNLSLRIKRNVSSASRESTVSPVDLQSKPGPSHIIRNKQTSAKNKILPSILVDSIHTRKRSETSDTASVLRQSWSKDRSPRPLDSTKQDIQDSPKMYGPEALKVMAKNLRITVINKRAVKSPQESSSDDSDDEEDDDSTDNDDEEEEEDPKVSNSSIAKVKGAAQKKTISDHSSA